MVTRSATRSNSTAALGCHGTWSGQMEQHRFFHSVFLRLSPALLLLLLLLLPETAGCCCSSKDAPPCFSSSAPGSSSPTALRGGQLPRFLDTRSFFFFSRFLKMSATSHPKHDSSKPNPFTNKEARIVIVGAGPAGKFRKRERKKENEKMKKKKMKFQEFQLGNFRGIHHKFT